MSWYSQNPNVLLKIQKRFIYVFKLRVTIAYKYKKIAQTVVDIKERLVLR